jgi:hypothetical protein
MILALGQRLHLIRGTIHMSRQLEEQRAAIDQCTEQEPAMVEFAANIELMRKLGPLGKLRVKMARLLAIRR